MKISSIINDLKNGIIPSKKVLLQIFTNIKNILYLESNIIYINGPSNIIGDIHGQFYDLINILDKINQNYNLIFLGDYVDRGYNSIEVMILCFLLKIDCYLKNIDNKNFIKTVTLLRGNHESRSQTRFYGFKEECLKKYDLSIYLRFCEIFDLFPIAAILNSTYFCIHGGIIPNLTINEIISTNRIQEYSEIADVLWSDPLENIDYFSESSRGAGYFFGKKALKEFLELINCKYLVRSHQLVSEGYQENLDGMCITIWGAPNYVYKAKNKAAVLVYDGKEHKFEIFEAVLEQYKLEN